MMQNQEYLPRLIAWEVTRSCVLSCIHCRAAATRGKYKGELTTAECFSFLEDVATFAKPIIILTGGEPMMRDDIFEIAKKGTDLGLRMVMAPCGPLMNIEKANLMKEVGIQRISLSIDGATSETHDKFRQQEGAFAGVMKAIECANTVGLEFQINTTITKINIHEVPEILKLAVALGAKAYHPFLLVPTGRGKDLADQEISPEDYEKTLLWIYNQRNNIPIQFKPTCAPHYYRIYRQQEKAAGRTVTVKSHGMDAMTKGCMGGTGFAFISNTGKVQICGFLEEECGDIKKEPFSLIWKTSKIFNEMRNIDGYRGKCGICEYRTVCGGCRARAYAVTGDYLAPEPYCTYTPRKTDKGK
ncbi:heme b synthase [Candidatus Desantisbacteria bacterium]|nr:heme b synthase [Candidatus Desantisbacteria bacterium]